MTHLNKYGELEDRSDICPQCGELVKPEWKACPHCAARLAPESRSCAECGAPMKPRWKACPACGYMLVEGQSQRTRDRFAGKDTQAVKRESTRSKEVPTPGVGIEMSHLELYETIAIAIIYAAVGLFLFWLRRNAPVREDGSDQVAFAVYSVAFFNAFIGLMLLDREDLLFRVTIVLFPCAVLGLFLLVSEWWIIALPACSVLMLLPED